MAVTNLLQFNPTQANQENDATYLADATRTGGAIDGNAWPSPSANKTLYQLSTYLTALFTAFANKGFGTSDAALSALTAQCANFLTTADQRGGMQNVAWAANITLDVSAFLCFNISLAGAVALATTSVQAGTLVVLIYTQDGTGGRVVAFGAGFSGAAQPAQAANAVSAQVFVANASLALVPIGPLISSGGINATPIGNVTPSTGAFTSLTAATGAFTSLTAATVASSDNSTNAATTAWARLGLSMSLGANGYIKLPTWLGGLILQWGTNGGGSSVAFSTVFTAYPSVTIGPEGGSANIVDNSISLSGFNLSLSSGGQIVHWVAVGY